MLLCGVGNLQTESVLGEYRLPDLIITIARQAHLFVRPVLR